MQNQPEPQSDTLPHLRGDVVLFETLGDFRHHFDAFVRHAALLVQSPPLGVGERRQLTLRICDLEITYPLFTSVQYGKDGVVGFAIEGFTDHQESLREIAEDIE